jgi:hypothetical protein
MAKSGSQRTADWRDLLKKQGYRQKNFLLSPAGLADLAAARKRFDSETEAVEAALKLLAARSNRRAR